MPRLSDAARRRLVQATTLLVGCVVMIVSGAMYNFSSYEATLKEQLNFTQTEVNTIGAAGNLGSNIAFHTGMMVDRRGFQLTLGISLALTVAGYLMSWAMAAGYMGASYILMSFFYIVFSQGQVYMYIAGLVVNMRNFSPRVRGSLVGLMSTMHGAAAGIYAAIYSSLYGFPVDDLSRQDLRGYYLFCAICAGVSVALAMAVTRYTREARAEAALVKQNEAEEAARRKARGEGPCAACCPGRRARYRHRRRTGAATRDVVASSESGEPSRASLDIAPVRAAHVAEEERALLAAVADSSGASGLADDDDDGASGARDAADDDDDGGDSGRRDAAVATAAGDSDARAAPLATSYGSQADATDTALSVSLGPEAGDVRLSRVCTHSSGTSSGSDVLAAGAASPTTGAASASSSSPSPPPASTASTASPESSVVIETHVVRGLAVFRRVEFWLLFIVYLTGTNVALVYQFNVSFMLRAFFMDADIALHAILIPVGSAAGRVFGGLLSDVCVRRCRVTRMVFILLPCILVTVAFVPLLFFMGSRAVMIGVSCIVGLSVGLFWVMGSIVTADQFGRHGAGQNWGLMLLSSAIGGSIYQWFSGALYQMHANADRQCYGLECYRWTIIICLLTMIPAFICCGILFKLIRVPQWVAAAAKQSDASPARAVVATQDSV